MKPLIRAGIYARISSDQDGRGLGVSRQVRDCRKLAADRGWEVADEYVDNDVSAYSGKPRAEYQRMLGDIQDGALGAVIVYNLDRLTRRPMELEQFLELCESVGMRNLATVTADIDVGNDDGLFMARVFAAFAAKESGRRSARVKRKMLENAERGLPHGGANRAFGYSQDGLHVVESEAVIIRMLVERLLAGESVRSLTTWLDETGVETVRGNPWRTPTVSALLQSARIAGLRSLNGEVVATAVWPAIISTQQRDKVLARFESRRVSGRRSPRSYLLTGLLRCGKCGTTLFSARRENSRRYVCSAGPDHGGCGRLTVVAQPVEELITEAVLYRLDTPELADALAGRLAADERQAAWAAELGADQEQMSELANLYAQKAITAGEWMTARNPIEARIRAAQRQLARVSGDSPLPGLAGAGAQLRGQWAELNLTRQAAIVGAVLDHAIIKPGTRGATTLDPARVDPRWRL